MVLARLLSPQDFGLVVLIGTITSFTLLLTELGLSAAVVQRPALTESLLSTAFWLNAATGVVLTVLVATLAGPISALLGQPAMAPLLAIASLGFALSCGSIHMALLQRTMRFRTLGSIEVPGVMVGLVTTIVLAAVGFGAYSLVIGPLAQTTITTVSYWWVTRWIPRAKPSLADARSLWSFGGSLTGTNMLAFVSRNADNVALAQTVSTAALGLYGRSYNLMMVPLNQVSSVLTRVLFPAFSRLSGDMGRFRQAWLKSVTASLAVGMPIGLGVATTAPAFVESLYGSKWLAMVPTLALLSLSVPPQLIGRNLGPVYQALGRTGQAFRQGLVTFAITIIAIGVGLQWGIVGVAAALLVKSYLNLAIPLIPILRALGFGCLEFLRRIGGIIAAAALLAAASWSTGQLAEDSLPIGVVLLLQIAAGATAYFLGLWLWARALFSGLWQTVMSRTARRPTRSAGAS